MPVEENTGIVVITPIISTAERQSHSEDLASR